MRAVFIKEWTQLLATPLALLFLIVFHIAAHLCTFYLGGYFGRGEAELIGFFAFHPWLYLFLTPALAMRLWAEETRSGTRDLLLSMPLPIHALVLGKFFGAWALVGVALLFTLPLWITTAWLGDPDHGVIAASYLASFLVAGAMLSLSMAVSAASRSPVSAFIGSFAICAGLLLAGLPVVTGWMPEPLLDVVSRLSLLNRADMISRGLLDPRDLLLLLALIGVGLGITTWLVSVKKSWPVLVLPIALMLTTLALPRLGQIDLTQQQLFTLSQGSRTILARLKEPVTMQLYVSRAALAKVPLLQASARRSEDLLSAYAAAAPSRVRLEVIDVAPASEAEDAALAAGLRPLPLPSGDSLMLGLVATDSANGRAIIPFLDPADEDSREYQISRMIDGLARPARPKVALLTSLPMPFGPGGALAFAKGQSAPYAVYDALREASDLSLLTPDFQAVPDGTALLILAHPRPLSPLQIDGIARYAARGGRLLILVDPVSEAANAMTGLYGSAPDAPAPASDLAALLGKWGVAMVPGKVVGDPQAAQPVEADGSRIPYLPWLALTGDMIPQNDPLLRGLSRLSIASAGALTSTPTPGVNATPLLRAGPQAALLDAASVRAGDPAALLQSFKPGGSGHILALRLNLEGGGAALIMADADWLADRFWLQNTQVLGRPVSGAIADNGTLWLNAIDQLLGDPALMSLRARRPASRPFTRIEQRAVAVQQTLRSAASDLQQQLTQTQQAIIVREGEMVSPDQMRALADLRRQAAQTRQALRGIERQLRQSLQGLEQTLIILNSLAVPIALILGALIVARFRRNRAAYSRTEPLS
jgi:ABC-type uncharacterized transport system involved in gliding motility auxiliary subunit